MKLILFNVFHFTHPQPLYYKSPLQRRIYRISLTPVA